VLAVNGPENTLTVLRGNGDQTTYDPRRQMGVSVYRTEEKTFAVGDRVQFTAPNRELKIANRELGNIEMIASNGAMQLKLDSGRSVEFGVQSFPHLDHGYAVTSHSSQGQTAERVLIHVDTELGAKDLLSHRMAYVSVSRGQWDAQIFTNDREKLAQALSHDVSHKSAFQPEQAISAVPQKIGPSPERVWERGMGYGLGL
jgi:ATP-dependent exoDNAse (exonuclease V) alpha subunit